MHVSLCLYVCVTEKEGGRQKEEGQLFIGFKEFCDVIRLFSFFILVLGAYDSWGHATAHMWQSENNLLLRARSVLPLSGSQT